jgi:NAD(P)-dependent dehydrogenase (short-subunit alcohol dehydrogenase family)
MRVLITGCSTGIGRGAAQALAARGHEVVATARRPETLRGLDVAARIALDVDEDASVRAAVAKAGALDALVNNAGRGENGPVERVPLAQARAMMETNFWGAVRMIQAVLPGMRERGRGVIVNVSSVSGRVGAPLGGFYTASKYALEGLSETLKLEVGHFGIRVALVEPGFFDTAFRGNAGNHGVEEPPYDELFRQWNGVDGKLLDGARPGPEAVAEAIADAVEGKDARLRIPVGKDAEMVLGARAKLDDAAFEAAMRQVLKLDW